MLGNYVVDHLTTTDAVKPAAEAAWSIGTRMLHDVAQATVVVGIPLVAAAWLAGPRGLPVAVRRAIAPTLRDRPAVAYTWVAVLLLLVVAWAPIPATRMPIPVVVMIGLAIAGMAALRRQVTAEFPDARAGAARAGLQDRAAGALHAMQAARRPERIDQLERLARLHDQGVLSDEQFAAETNSVLADGSGRSV
jgi:hypothetical protein